MSNFESKKICEVLKMVQDHKLLLPAFQREYVWRPEQVERLFDSLMKGYPINSMLFWRVGREVKDRYRFYGVLDKYVETFETHNDVFDTSLKDWFYAIIDGQQRLTSLNLGLRGTYAYRRKRSWAGIDSNYPSRRLYLNLSTMLSEEDSGMTYDFEFIENGVTQTEDLYTDGEGRKWFRIGKVLDFSDEVEQRSFYRSHDMTLEEESMLARLYRTVFHEESINFYVIDGSEPNTAVDVFVRTNSGGTTLNYADILLSIVIANWEQHHRDARNEIHGLVDEVNNRLGFSISHDYVLKAFLLMKDKDVKMRVTSFNNQLLDEIASEWDDIRVCIVETYALMRLYGLDGGRLTSNYATLPVLLYLYRRRLWPSFVNGAAHRDYRAIIRRWVLKTLLMQTFGYRSDWALRRARTVVGNDVKWLTFPAIELEQALGQTEGTEALADRMLEAQKESRLAWLVLSLIYNNRMTENTAYHLDHLHSANECIRAGLDKEVWNSVLNLQLLEGHDNIEKTDMPLEEWVRRQTERTDRWQFMESRLIPDVNLSIGNFEEFIEERRRMLRERLIAVI